jgi:hypothetical protein
MGINCLYRSVFVSLTKGNESAVNDEKIGVSCELEEKISNWWHRIGDDLKLTPSNIAKVPYSELPKVLLVNIVYHHCLCALHVSFLPLFCLTLDDGSWSSQRQLSAQAAYKHASLGSDLIATSVSTSPRLSAIPSFTAYAAYCACAIQIPFVSCSNVIVRKSAVGKLAANVKMIEIMAKYWRFPALLVCHTTFTHESIH